MEYRGQVQMRYHSHDAGDFVGGRDAADLALRAHRCRESVFVGLEDGGLMKTDGGSVNAHVGKDDIGTPETIWQLQM